MNEVSFQERLGAEVQSWGVGVEGLGRAGWPLGRLRAQSEVTVGGGLS